MKQQRADPTQEEIRQRCEEIRAGWSDEEAERRWVGDAREGWTVPHVRARGIAEPVASED